MHKILVGTLRKRMIIAAAQIVEKAYRRGFYAGIKASGENINITDCKNFCDKTYRHMYHAPKYIINRPDGKYGKTVIEPMETSIEEYHFPLGSAFLSALEKYENELELETKRNERINKKIKGMK